MLVTEVKKQMRLPSSDMKFAIIDGSLGIGCPVIASCISGLAVKEVYKKAMEFLFKEGVK